MVPPFIFGGRQAYGQLVLAALVLATFGFWLTGKLFGGQIVIPYCRPEIFLPISAIGLSIISWIYLPRAFIEKISPGIPRLLPEWSASFLGQSSAWHSLSLTPGLSRDASLLFILYVLLFWITLDTVRHRESAYGLLRILFVSGVGVSAVGLLHYLFWNGKFYWLWDVWWVDPDRQVRAPFTNRNHFAGFLALTLGPGVVVLTRVIRETKKNNYLVSTKTSKLRRIHDLRVLFVASGLTLILAGIALSQSRGGVIVGIMVAAACLVGLYRNGLNRITGLAAAAVILLGSLGLTVTFGRQNPFQRTAEMLEGNQSLDAISNVRLQLWMADLQAFFDFPLLGSGPGSHQYVCPLYFEKAYRFTFTHAENCYVQILVECGLAGVALLLMAIVLLIRWSWRGLRHDGHETNRLASDLSLAVTVSLLAALVHALVDFVWYVPAYAVTIAILAGLCRALARRKESQVLQNTQSVTPNLATFLRLRSSILRWGLGAASIGLVALIGQRFVQAVPTEYAWNNFYHFLPSDQKDNPTKLEDNLEDRISWLTEACNHDSPDPEHYYRLGLAKLELFLQHQKASLKPVGLLETRRIFRETKFESPAAARDWLQARFGDDFELLESAHMSLIQSLICCPLFGSSYLQLAKLSFLESSNDTDLEVYWRQAQLTSPYDPDVHMQIGLEEWVVGDHLKARDSWRRACELSHECEIRLLPLLSAQLPAQKIVELLPLDFEGLKWLAQKEIDMGRTDESQVAVIKAQEAVEADLTQAKNPAFWVALSELYQQAELPAQAQTCLRKALRLAPDRLGLHWLLIRLLMEDGQWKAALEQAQDSRQQFNNQPEVRNLINDILVMRAPKAAKISRHANGEH
jgi:O-antigen ligase/tetratricopeptide (TPR) repeat protein